LSILMLLVLYPPSHMLRPGSELKIFSGYSGLISCTGFPISTIRIFQSLEFVVACNFYFNNECTNEASPYECTNEASPYECTNEASLYECTNEASLYECTNEASPYECTNLMKLDVLRHHHIKGCVYLFVIFVFSKMFYV